MLSNLMMMYGWRIRNFFEDEDGIGVVEVILILLVLVGLVLVFKDNIHDLATSIFHDITTQSKDVGTPKS